MVSHCYLKKILNLELTIVLVLVNFCQTYYLYLIYTSCLHVKESVSMSVCAGLSVIETSMCAQALWVDVSSSLGRNPPSSYPSGEQSAAKPNLGFTAFDKPSNGTGQRASERERERQRHTGREREWERGSEDKNITLVQQNRVVGLCLCVLLLPQD